MSEKKLKVDSQGSSINHANVDLKDTTVIGAIINNQNYIQETLNVPTENIVKLLEAIKNLNGAFSALMDSINKYIKIVLKGAEGFKDAVKNVEKIKPSAKMLAAQAITNNNISSGVGENTLKEGEDEKPENNSENIKKIWDDLIDHLKKSWETFQNKIMENKPFEEAKRYLQEVSDVIDNISQKVEKIKVPKKQDIVTRTSDANNAESSMENKGSDGLPENKASGGLAQQGDVVGGGEFVMTRAATKNWGADFLDSLNNFQMPAMPKMPELSELPLSKTILKDFAEGGNLRKITQHIVNLDINKEIYPMNTTEDVFTKIVSDFKAQKSYWVNNSNELKFADYLEKRFNK
ncbi:MAG: hypothetical protein HQK91_10920 [Nitrospirae bacterium]|nr:hypothetical protein [Nitrospirota bacterium]MBF0541946.1 hypothetical protein [Nitrospirota bacterium]